MARVLQAESVRMMYRQKRALLDDEDGEGKRDSKRRKKGGEVQKPVDIKVRYFREYPLSGRYHPYA
jgi:hypothetical protein